jgi:hypothetical protein
MNRIRHVCLPPAGMCSCADLGDQDATDQGFQQPTQSIDAAGKDVQHANLPLQRLAGSDRRCPFGQQDADSVCVCVCV